MQSIGDSVYRRIADSRACKLTPRHKTPIPEPSNKVLIITATILIAGNVIYGFMGKGSGWPFACYPTFSEIAWNRYRSIECQVVFPDGKEETVRMQSLKKYGAAYRISSMMGKIFSIKDEQLRTKKFLALWEVFVKTDPKFKDAKTVRFYFAENDTDPANWHLNPLERKLAFEFTVNP